MGYESKVLIYDRTVMQTGFVNALEIARFDLCKMGYVKHMGKEFREVFTKPIDFALYDIHANEDDLSAEERMQDLYGEHCKYAKLTEVRDWLNRAFVEDPDICTYRRAIAFRDCIEAYIAVEDKFDQLIAVHFGC